MKKLISITLVLVMLLSLFSGTVYAADTDSLVITSQDVHTVRNSWATVTLRVKQNPGFQGMSFYPVITDANGNKVDWSWEVDNANSDLNFDVNAGKMVVLTADEDQTATGILLEMRFFVGEKVALGTYTISFQLYSGECFNADGNPVSVELPTVLMNVTNVVYGDVNGDTVVDLADVLVLRKYLVNQNPFTGESTIDVSIGADANGDGAVDLIDVLLLRRYLANRDPETGESTVVLGPPIEQPTPGIDDGNYTYTDSVTALSDNWNIHTYETSDQSYPIEFLTSSLYRFIYNDALHPLDGQNPYEGYVIVPEMASEMPIDVTKIVKRTHPQFGIPADATEGYAYVIKLNPDACWDDGTPITATDWIESMKRLLDPKLQNFRASSYYDATFSIAGAEQYHKAGQAIMTDNGLSGAYAIADLIKGADGTYTTPNGESVYIAVNYPLDWLGGNTLMDYVDAYGSAYFGLSRWKELTALMNADGLAVCTDETLAMLSATTANPNWGESDADLPRYLVYRQVFPECSFENVGLYQTGEYEITLVLNKALTGFQLLYQLPSSWLVKTDLYDACLKQEGDAWFSTYCTSVETTPSYGPYVMSNYQMYKSMHFVKNENWWGYSDGKHVYVDPEDGLTYPMYMTTEIDTVVVTESATVKMMFLKGQLMTYTLQTADYGAYRNSAFCYFTPGQAVYFLILNGNMSMIKEREAAADFDATKYDLETLTLQSFHRAMNLSYDRSEYSAEFNPAQSPAFGLIGTAYISNPDTGARYRDTQQAKQVLCDVYGVDVSKYESLDAAVDSITGYDPVAANGWFAKAYEEALAAGFVTDNDGDGKSDQQIEMIYSASTDPSEKMQKIMKWLGDCANEAAKGTGFEGKISVVASAPLGSDWSAYIRAGQTDCVLGGWNGSAMDPYGLMEVFTNPSYQYDAKWFDSTSITLTLNLRGEDITMNLQQWQQCMTGTPIKVGGKTYNFGDGIGTYEERLTIMAALEKEILLAYNYLPMTQAGSMFLLSQKASYVTEEYNPVMGRGGIAYLRYNFTDEEWNAYLASHNYDLSEEYKKSKPTEPSNPDDSDFDPADKSEGVMTYAEYMAAPMCSEVVIEAYVQATQEWWNNTIAVYAQDPDGAYFIYDMACSEADAAKLTKGTKIRVTGYKDSWAGEIEIMDATFEFVNDGTWIAEATDVTSLLGTDTLIDHQNKFVVFKGLTIEAINYKNGAPGDDIYVDVSYNGVTYGFCVERYLTDPDTEVYKAFASLKAGDKVDIEGFLFWYNGVNTHITSVKLVSNDVTFVDMPVVGTAYKFAVQQNNLGQTIYFTGEMAGYYLDTSTDPADGVDIFIENVDGGQRIFFINPQGVKIYIDVVPRGADYPGRVTVVLSETPSCVYTWDALRKTFITNTIADNVWYLGCYNTYNTISASNVIYIEDVTKIGDTQFPAGFCTVGGTENPSPAWADFSDPMDNWNLIADKSSNWQRETNAELGKTLFSRTDNTQDVWIVWKVDGYIREFELDLLCVNYGLGDPDKDVEVYVSEDGNKWQQLCLTRTDLVADPAYEDPANAYWLNTTVSGVNTLGDTYSYLKVVFKPFSSGINWALELDNLKVKVSNQAHDVVTQPGTFVPTEPTQPTEPPAGSTLSILEAIALGASQEHNCYTEGKYYVTGVIVEVKNSTYGNMYISDGEGNVLYIYGTFNADGTTRYDAMENPPVVGDTVTIYGIIGQYNGTPQMKNGWIMTN